MRSFRVLFEILVQKDRRDPMKVVRILQER